MKKTLILTIIAFFVLYHTNLQSQTLPKEAKKFASSIQEQELREHLFIIAADSMEGRYTGTEGGRKAARYIAQEFEQLGLLPPVVNGQDSSYFQKFQFSKRTWTDVYLKIGANTKILNQDFGVLGYSIFREETTLNAIFIGKGTPEEWQNLSIKNKIVVMNVNEVKHYQAIKAAGVAAIFMVGAKNASEFEEFLEYNAYYFKRPIEEMVSPNNREGLMFFLSPATAAEMFNISEAEFFAAQAGQLPEATISLKADFNEKISLESENVLGLLEGTDKKDEYLIITAHYDHVGVDKATGDVYNGADDDGSGTVAVLEIAEAFVQATQAGFRPRRSILFMTVSGEEIGLYGSLFYTDYQPIFPLEQTVANLNIDMIGRIDDEHQNNPFYVYLIGSDKLSDDLHTLSENINEEFTQMELNYTFNDENDPNRFYYRSDHYNFAKNNIPIIFYFNGVHEDYHKPTDTPDKIAYPKLTKTAQLVFHTAWEIAQREQRIMVDEWKKEKQDNQK